MMKLLVMKCISCRAKSSSNLRAKPSYKESVTTYHKGISTHITDVCDENILVRCLAESSHITVPQPLCGYCFKAAGATLKLSKLQQLQQLLQLLKVLQRLKDGMFQGRCFDVGGCEDEERILGTLGFFVETLPLLANKFHLRWNFSL